MPPKYLRRLISFPGLVLLTVILIVSLPILLPVAFVVDCFIGIRRLRCVRTVVFLLWFLTIEFRTFFYGVRVWVRHFGRIGHERPQKLLQSGLAFYGHNIWRITERVFGLRLIVTGKDAVEGKPAVICFPHHTSILDSVLPIELLGHQLGYDLRYVIKKTLAWIPAIDLVGKWLPVHYVDRTGKKSGEEMEAIAALATDVTPGSAPVIYPEGTFYTPKRLARAVERMKTQDPTLVERTERLRHVLPPRTGGALAMLEAAPDADVLFIVHVGFEPYVNMARIFANLPFRRPVEAHLWRVPRSEVPVAAEEQYRWLFAQFEFMDQWVADRLDQPVPSR